MTNQVQYTATGVTSVFPFPFAINADTDCQVLIDGVVQSGDYSIRGQGSIDGGAVVFDSAPIAGKVIAIRRVGEVGVTAMDASGGYLADKLVAGTGITVDTVTEGDGAQHLVISGGDISLALLAANNLQDVPNKPEARGHLGVYSTGETDAAITAKMTSTGLLKANNLNDVANVSTARANLGVYSTGEADTAMTDKVAANGLLKANNLGDVPNKAAARTALGLDQVAYLNAAQDWTAPQRSQAVQTVSVGGSTVLSLSQYQNFNLTLTANITFANPASITADMVGQKGTIGITPAGFAIADMGSQWKRVGNTGKPDVITGIGRIDYHIRATDRIEYAYNDVEA